MTNDTTKNDTIAPVYRYYVEDLISGKKLAELDFRGVSYKLALNSAGDFSGSLVVKDVNNATNLYNATLPGVTALYVLRNGVCVWGGIIWEREYIPEDKSLNVSASEFTSYLHHRKIWKTWNHEFEATVSNQAVTFNNGSSALVKGGSTVRLDFYEVENFVHNGYYRVLDYPNPTQKGFYIIPGSNVNDLRSLVYETPTKAKVTTKENHGFSDGETAEIRLLQLGSFVSGADGFIEPFKINVSVPEGPNSNYFYYSIESPGVDPSSVGTLFPADGYVYRPMPLSKTFEKVTVGVRQDTFDYVKSLVEGTFNDFVGTDFPNVYIEPGISTGIDIVSKKAFNGYNILTTSEKHNVSVGQAVQIQDVGPEFDGEFEITGVEDGYSLVYEGSGTVSPTPVSILSSPITIVEQSGGIATIQTVTAHGMTTGQNVEIDLSVRFPDITGSFKILDTPSSTRFRVLTGSSIIYPATSLSDYFISSGGSSRLIDSVGVQSGFARISTKVPHGILPGSTVTVGSVPTSVEVIERSLDGPNGVATIQTSRTHGFPVGTSVTLTGLTDSVSIDRVQSTTTRSEFSTTAPHNLRVGDSVTISGVDVETITSSGISSNVGTITTSVPTNFPIGGVINIENLMDQDTEVGYSISDGVATITTSSPHNIAVNDEVSLQEFPDIYAISTKSAVDGDITLTIPVPHNIWQGAKITVTGLGAPFDGEATVTDITDQRVMYKANSRYIDDAENAALNGYKPSIPITVPEQKVPLDQGRILVKEGFLVGDWRVSARTSTTISIARGGNNYTRASSSLTTYGSIYSLSPLNGVRTVTARTANTLSFSVTANNRLNSPIPTRLRDTDVYPIVYRDSVYSGNRTVTSTSSKKFAVSMGITYATEKYVSITASKPSIFNGNRVITSVPTSDRFTFSISGYSNSMLEQAQGTGSYATASLFAGTYTVNTVPDNFSFTFTKPSPPNLEEQKIQNRGTATVTPLAITSTFGPFPGNANIEFVFPDNEYSGVNIQPNMYRGFELKSVGEALDEYANSVDGFEYRIDCEYLEDEDRFIKKFRIIPINFPNAPGEGEVSPISRFGADKLVFEYPSGSISTFSMRESAEEAATRFFALGENELGPDVGPYIGVASANDLLRGERDGRRWPLLDASDTVDGIDDKAVLYAYAKRYLSELQPPFATFQITVNGSRSPFVGTYKPGDWCSIVVDDPWMQMRLASDLEPRSDVLVRKIDSISVSVPDGVTYPEAVTVNLVAEWEVDKRG